jgi:carbon storage regulator
MLVLRRKAGEAIVLNQVIKIRVLGVEGDRVKLGIDAPPDVIVVREELLEIGPNGSRSNPTPAPAPNDFDFDQ